MHIKLAYKWGDHEPGEIVQVDDRTGGKLLRQGKGREVDEPVKVPKTYRRKVKEELPELPTVEAIEGLSEEAPSEEE